MTVTEQVNSIINEDERTKKAEWLKEEAKKPNRKIYHQRLILGWAEVIEYDKDKLKYEETSEDQAANQAYFKSLSTDIGDELLKAAKEVIQDNPNFCIEQFEYAGRTGDYTKKPNIKVIEANVDINNLPDFLKNALAAATGCSDCEEGCDN